MSDVGQRIDLVAEPDFRLGGLWVSPSACKVQADGGGEERVEPRVMEVLVALTKAPGRTVTRDELVELCWGGRAVSDDAVSRVIAKVRQLARCAEPPPFTLETVPRVGFRFVPAEPRSPPQEEEHELQDVRGATSSPTPAPARSFHSAWLAVVAVAVAATAALALLLAGMFERGGADGPADRIALLPFTALHSAAELDRLSRLANDAVARRLTSAGVSTVVAGASAEPGLSAFTAELTVTGSVDREGDKFKVKATISQRASGLVLWSRAFERPAHEPEGLHEEAAISLAYVLSCALHERKTARTAMTAAVFSLFMNSCEDALRQPLLAMEVTRRLVEKAPTVAGAHAQRALAVAHHTESLDYLNEEAAQYAKEVRDAAERALALDSTTANAHVALGMRVGPDLRFAERERHLRRALDIDPDHVAARIQYGKLLREVGRIGAARENFNRVEATAGGLIQGVFLAAMQGDLRAAYPMIERLEVLRPVWARDARWTVTLWWDDPAGALQHADRLVQEAGRTPGDLACLKPHLAVLARAQGRSVRGLAEACERFSIDWRVRLLARQGDIDGAYELMAQPFPNSRLTSMFLFYPEMKAFRRDARFAPLAERLGLVVYWHESGSWPDDCAVADAPAWCRRSNL